MAKQQSKSIEQLTSVAVTGVTATADAKNEPKPKLGATCDVSAEAAGAAG